MDHTTLPSQPQQINWPSLEAEVSDKIASLDPDNTEAVHELQTLINRLSQQEAIQNALNSATRQLEDRAIDWVIRHLRH